MLYKTLKFLFLFFMIVPSALLLALLYAISIIISIFIK